MRLLLFAALLLSAAPLAAQPDASLTEARLRFTLSGTLDTGQPTTDWAFLRFLPDALPGWDPHDASKFSSAPAQIAFSARRDRQRVRLGMDSRPDGTVSALPHSFTLKMGILAEAKGTLTLAWDGALAPGWRVTLIDRETGARTKMWRETSYTFQQKATGWTERFRLRVRPAPPESVAAPPAALTVAADAVGTPFPNPTRGASQMEVALEEARDIRVSVLDALGREVAVAHEGRLGAGSHALALGTEGPPPGLYLVRLTGEGLAETRRLTVAR